MVPVLVQGFKEEEPEAGRMSLEPRSKPGLKVGKGQSQPEIAADIRLLHSLHGSGFTILIPGFEQVTQMAIFGNLLSGAWLLWATRLKRLGVLKGLCMKQRWLGGATF